MALQAFLIKCFALCVCRSLYFPQQTPDHAKRRDATDSAITKEEGASQRALADFFLREFCDNIKEVGAS